MPSNPAADETSPPLDPSQHLISLLQAMRTVSRELVQQTEMIPLFQGVCASLVKTRGYVAVWIGKMDLELGEVIPLAVAGAEAERFPHAKITWDESPTGLGPAGTAIRTRQPVVFDDLASDPRFAPWRSEAVALGAASIASLPLVFQERVLGALTVKYDRVHAFSDTEVRLLAELAEDIAHAWFRIEVATAHDAANEELLTLIEAIPDQVFLKDGQGRWQIINSAAAQVFQTDRRPWRGRTDRELAGDIPALQAAHECCAVTDEQAWQVGEMWVGEEYVETPEGVRHSFQVHKVPILHSDGRRKGLVVVARDITKTKQIQDQLRISELMSSCNRDIILRIRVADGQLLDANAAATKAYGYSREELQERRIQDLRLDPEPEVLAQMRRGADVTFFETIHRRKDGSLLPVEVSSQKVTLVEEEMIVSNIRDISSRKKAEATLRLLQAGIQSAVNGIVVTDVAGRIEWANPAFFAMNGYTEGELCGQPMSRLKSGRQSPECYAAMWAAILHGERWMSELVNRRKDGSFYAVSQTVSPVTGAAGEITHFIAIQEDVTDRKRTEAAVVEANARLTEMNAKLEQRVAERTRELTEAKVRFETIFECSPLGVAIMRLIDRCFLNVNQAFAEVFGFTREEMLGRSAVAMGLHGDNLRAAKFAEELTRKGRSPVRLSKS